MRGALKSISRGSFVRVAAATAFAYAVCALLALRLVGLEGFAAPFWPAAGVAFAACSRFGRPAAVGTWLGAFGINILASLPTAPQVSPGPRLLVAAALASGSVLQAVAIARLSRSRADDDFVLVRDTSIGRFFLVSALGCMVAAFVGTGTLYVSHQLFDQELAASFVTWWVGDLIGVISFGPVFYSWVRRDVALWNKRRVVLAVVQSVVVLVSVAAVWRATTTEQEQRRLAFDNQTDPLERSVQRAFQEARNSLGDLWAFYAASAEVQEEEFSVFASGAMVNRVGVQGFAWIPLTRAGGVITRSHVAYVEPESYLVQLQGRDLYGDAEWHHTLSSALEQNGLASEFGVALPKLHAHPRGLLAAMPTHARTPGREVDGFVAVVFCLQELVTEAAQGFALDSLRLTLKQYLPNGKERVAYANYHGPEAAYFDKLRARSKLERRTEFVLGGTRYVLFIEPSGATLAAQVPTSRWVLLMAMLGIAGALNAFLLLVTARSAQVEEQVRRRTEQLRRANQILDKRAQELHTETEKTEDARARLQALFDSVGDGVLLLDAEGRVLSANPAAQRMFDRSESRLTGEPALSLLEASEANAPLGSKGQKTQFSDFIGQVVEARAIVGPKRWLPVDMSVSEMKVRRDTFFILLLRDATPRKQIETLKDEFVSTVSHELRTPLTSIFGSLQLVIGGATGDIPPKGRELLEIARNNTQRLVRLINSVLDLQKLRARAIEMLRVFSSATQIAEASIQSIQGMAELARVRVECAEMPATRLFVDEDRLVQVLVNLLSNAIKVSTAGATVRVEASVRDDRIRFSVIDHGPGIAASDHARLFREFQQLDSSDRRLLPGTGLGLAISKALIEQHDGSIGFDTEVGVGTTFWFEVPVGSPRG